MGVPERHAWFNHFVRLFYNSKVRFARHWAKRTYHRLQSSVAYRSVRFTLSP